MGQYSAVYQTLEDRDNADQIEFEGPFPCNKEKAWLGSGYYFWDFHIELAHWWGKKSYSLNSYIICKAFCIISPDKCWDLHNEGKHREEFNKALNALIRKGAKKNEISFSQVIEYAKINGFFNHEAIRVNSIGAARKTTEIDVGFRLKFSSGNDYAYFDLFPPIQICLLNKTALSLKNYKIVWPDHYVIEDTVF